MARFQCEQCVLAIEPARITGKRTAAAHDPVTRNDDRQRIATGRRSGGADRRRTAAATCEFAVRDRCTERHGADGRPHLTLERRALRRQRQIERRASTREILAQLRNRVAKERQSRGVGPLGRILGKIFLALEIQTAKRVALRIGNQQDLAQRARCTASRLHRFHVIVSIEAFLHKCITAYARHGRQASLRARARAERVSPIALNTMRSLSGNASGQPSARIAM